jgi:peptidoglycan/xylan/chitin deacetylase (PgdA/CDA1 family)
MGCGAIFMIHRVYPLNAGSASRGMIPETDPQLLREMINLVAAKGLDAVSLSEMRSRLESGPQDRPFVCFTFDGAYKTVRDIVLPMFAERGMPFAVYAATDYLGNHELPWWLALQALVEGCERLSFALGGGEQADFRCRAADEKQAVFALLFRRLSRLDARVRQQMLDGILKKHGIDKAAAAEREMLAPDELRALAETDIVTIGALCGGDRSISEFSYDQARQVLEHSLHKLEAVTGKAPRNLAFQGPLAMPLAPRDAKIASDLGLETAVTAVEGALWPEHRREMHALPRIALDNDPAALVRALMLSSGVGDSPVMRRQAVAV